MTKILSIILATIRQQPLSQLLDNLEETASDMDSFEVLVKLDDDDSEMIAYLETEKKRRPFSIKYIATPRLDGYWSLYLGYNELCGIASPETYFVIAINDQTTFATRHWDDILRSYVGYFPDNVFHLRISSRRRLEFKSLVECIPYGENYGFFTKQWLSMTEGVAIGEACVDTGQECVNYFLRTKCGYFRGVPVDAIKIANEDIAVSGAHGLTTRQSHIKQRGVWGFYTKLLTRDGIENFYRLAQKLHAYIWANESGLSHFQIEEDRDNKEILVKISPESDPLKSFPYELDFLTWVSILFDIEPVRSTLSYLDTMPPVLANRVLARRQLAELWLNTAPEQAENAYSGDLGKAHKKMLSKSIRHNYLDAIEQSHINTLVKGIAGGHSELDESAFVDDLLVRILDKSDEKIPVQYFLAARLYCSSDKLLSQGFDLSHLPEWSPGALNLSKIHKMRLIVVKFIPSPVRNLIALILTKIKNLLEKARDLIEQVYM